MQRRLHRCTGGWGALQDLQSELEGGALRGHIKGFAGGVAKREIAEQQTRHTAVFHDILGTAHNHRRDAMRFQVPGDQTHGLVAHRSSGHDEGGVDLVLLAAVQNLRAIRLQRDALTAIRRHAMETRRHGAKASARSRLL